LFDGIEHVKGRGDDFLADSIPGDHGQFELFHCVTILFDIDLDVSPLGKPSGAHGSGG
jgi:hypothetical protein